MCVEATDARAYTPVMSTETAAAGGECPHCRKPANFCVCDGVVPVANRIALLTLQHPQEQERLLGTARLATRHLENAAQRIGLSRPSLAKEASRPHEPRPQAS